METEEKLGFGKDARISYHTWILVSLIKTVAPGIKMRYRGNTGLDVSDDFRLQDHTTSLIPDLFLILC